MKASQFIGRNQLLQKTRPLTSLNFSSRALSFGLLRFSNDRPGKCKATKPDLIRLTSPLHYKFRKGSKNDTAGESMKLDNEKVESENKMTTTKWWMKFFQYYICFQCLKFLLDIYFHYCQFEIPFKLLEDNGYTRNMYNNETNILLIVLDPTLYMGMTAPQNPTYFKEKHNFQYLFLKSKLDSESFYNQCLLAMNRLAMETIIKRLLPIYGNPENTDSGSRWSIVPDLTMTATQGSHQWGVTGSGPIWVKDTTDHEQELR